MEGLSRRLSLHSLDFYWVIIAGIAQCDPKEMLKGESLQEAMLRKSDKGIETDGKRDGGGWTDRGLEKR